MVEVGSDQLGESTGGGRVRAHPVIEQEDAGLAHQVRRVEAIAERGQPGGVARHERAHVTRVAPSQRHRAERLQVVQRP